MLTLRFIGKCFLPTTLALLLVGCSTGLNSQPDNAPPTNEESPIISQAELEEIIARGAANRNAG